MATAALTLDAALDIVGTLRLLKSREANAESDKQKKAALEQEVNMLLAEEKIIHQDDKNPDIIRISIMDKVKRLYAPLLKNYYKNIAPELTQEDYIALAQSKKEDEQGLHISSEDVHKEAIALCMK